jgi:ABC-type antimicrobial peptide transport system permease subunit
LPEGTKLADLNARLKGIADKYINKHESRPGSRTDFEAQPLQDIHFNSTYAGGGQWVQAVNANWLWVFGIIGLAVLILACINFINLSTAQALTRTREIGVSKALGAGRMLLIWQFMVEAWVLAFASGLLALGVTYLSMPLINTLMEKQIDYNFLQNPILITVLLLGIALTGLLAGLYPAWILTRFNPVEVLKAGSRAAGDHRSTWLRKGLVVTQFSISIILLVAVALMAQQVNYLRSKNLGFDHDNVVTVNLPQMDKAALFRSKLNEVASIKNVSFSTSTPAAEGHWGTVMSLTNGDDPQRKEVTLILADPQFRDLYNLKLVAGRFLEPADTSLASRTLPDGQQIFNVVINQKSVKSLGFASAEDALNKKFWFGMNSGNARIVGVVADFNATSLHNAIQPILMTQISDYYSLAGIKIEANNNIPQTIAAIEKAWKTSFPDQIFDYKFLNQQIDAFYKAEARLYTLFKIFALLAVVISCLGLYGLATFAAQQRTKEIGIRKVLGASVAGITGLLTKEFMALVLIAMVIASPIAYYAMQQWLADFAYHINVRWEVFAGVGILAMAVAFLTVAGQSIRAAMMNPVESLRSE